ncbi:J domain-containing protein [Paramicrobacterium chengjingii]|uniref:DnaJ domain-containing protein n=1 Tax=Paramicrobacterium chengjingii TaxID=2769067 RepID=A0ABX6YI57_9MICO|nr:DnaJ domain-containing protein [Microbacterium chengjingii]QPZ38514.1 DnaJ domain-containing protein [Microbacterium chengjingii]
MTESPLDESPYDVLGVDRSVSDAQLRRAYRRRARQTHPDLGGSAALFNAVQLAWEHVGTPEARAQYDKRSSARPASAADTDEADHVWSTGRTQSTQRDSRPKARMYGHPGGRARDRFTTLMREWVGRGTEPIDIYDEALIRRAPTEIRHSLADALAEEATARALGELGMGYTVWHGVATDRGSDRWVVDADAAASDTRKIDHVVLGPSGLFAVQSEDWGAPARVRRADLISEALGKGEKPMHALATRAKAVARAARVTFTALVIVLPDEALDAAITALGRNRGIASFAVQRSVVGHFLRTGVPDATRPAGTDMFEVRTRLQNSIHLV